ncbi:disease resistance protein Roq1-like [Syzygium oleosum]|uniref:disease resistance protein Roq1-like n=1 Tax=Syzygium oleosum TaxID=219896 RepID=UPI0024B970A8|nr:disease resistance protein Roq1-like [Syzygium oleosum]XP_056174537.1 disease resistance protein Roq1-like [Syzygium oleosum]
MRMRSPHEVQDEGLTIGLWAMGGMGKTTLALALFNSIFEKFDGSAFLDGISSDSKILESLQEKLLSTLTSEEIRVTNCRQGINLIKERLCHKRVLLILDGVDHICQIEALAGEHNWFGYGSRIVVTTRDKNVLDKIKAIIHEVKALEAAEARELFEKYASGNGNKEITVDLVDEALHYTQRHPLALKALGSTFFAKDASIWKRELDQFAGSSHPTIHTALEQSLHGLDDITKDIFLDIACFFDGWNRKYVEGLLRSCYADNCYGESRYDDSCYDVPDSKVDGIVNDLMEKSLIRDENGTIQVHRLIKLMGQKIADGKHRHNLAKRSRLWRCEEVVKVLSRDEGQYDVEAIVLAPKKPVEIEKIGSNPFAKLTNLRYLIMINVTLKTSFPRSIVLPHQLRWFEWPECPASCLKFSPTPLNPAVLAVRKSLLVKNRGEA